MGQERSSTEAYCGSSWRGSFSQEGWTKEVVWSVVPESHPDGEHSSVVISRPGLKSINKENSMIILAYILLYIKFIDWNNEPQKINTAIKAESAKAGASMKAPLFWPDGFIISLGLFICKEVDPRQKEFDGSFSVDFSD